MAYNRGDIVEVYFDLPYSKETKLHPSVIISNQDVYDADEIYICAMITSSDQTDQFSFKITDDMLVNKSKKITGQVRCHLVTYIKESHVFNGRALNSMKQHAVNRLVERISEVSLSEDED
ncbi:type II toxin-antitoxin system PemK/MazF family toxin [Flagellimonas sp. SN16]|uniref:type II toxin-antitoxin system PemK/MazF family toxin n=1 Tax=Flagellimonas sp. SN16 TaxID=3415142 RepID=UPI003C4C2AFF